MTDKWNDIESKSLQTTANNHIHEKARFKKKENGKIPLEKNETTIDLSITRSDQGSIINRQYFFF